MSKIIPSTANLLSGNTIKKLAVPVATITKAKYSLKKEATFEIKPYKLHKLEKGPAPSATLTHEDALKIYHKLAVLRRLETSAGNLYKEKVIRGFCHLYSGQEAVAVGMNAVMRKTDTLVTSYRCHVWTYLLGVSAIGVLSELAGRRTGCCRGKGGSMHLYGPNFFGGNGVVGAQASSLCTVAIRYIIANKAPLGAGLAFAHKYKGDGGVAFSLYGDGAANQGQLFEAYNIAKLWDLPCVFVCENNRYGPLVVEMETYRYTGHSMSDPGTSYRTRGEVQEVRQKRDPINSFKDKILTNNLATPDQLKAIDAEIRKEIDEAVKVAKSEPEIGVEELAGDIYVRCAEKEIRGVHPQAPLKHIEVVARK